MRITPLFLLALAIMPATVTAEPSYDRRPYATYPEGRHPPWRDHDWVQLATPTPTRFGTEYITISDARSLRSLRIQRTTGTVVLREVRIYTRDHRGMYARSIPANVRLDRWHPSTVIDLGRPTRVDQIAITTDRRPAGSYVVFGSLGTMRDDVAMR